jgi:hypothetical protein
LSRIADGLASAQAGRSRRGSGQEWRFALRIDQSERCHAQSTQRVQVNPCSGLLVSKVDRTACSVTPQVDGVLFRQTARSMAEREERLLAEGHFFVSPARSDKPGPARVQPVHMGRFRLQNPEFLKSSSFAVITPACYDSESVNAHRNFENFFQIPKCEYCKNFANQPEFLSSSWPYSVFMSAG